MEDWNKARRQQELADARARLVEHLQRVVGSELSAEAAQALLERAGAWDRAAKRLDAHLAEYPDALTAPEVSCPPSLDRLLRALAAAGHGSALTLPACVECGRTEVPLRRRSATGRCCERCANRDCLRRCARCGQDGHLVARRPEGPICRRCYRRDPAVLEECGTCGQRRRVTARDAQGRALCGRCRPRPQRACVGCGQLGPVEAIGPDGPLCRRCHQRPARPCGICGRTRPVHVRATDSSPDVCAGCYRGALGRCEKCGRDRPGSRHRGGPFLCDSCQPRPVRRCVDCGRDRQVKVTGWPLGVLCASCYSRRKRNPAPCTGCAAVAVLVGRAPEGGNLCGRCAGVPSLDYTCPRCGQPGQIHADGGCARCVLRDRLRVLLHGQDPTAPARLQPLIDALAAAESPWSVLDWLATSPSAALLASLAADSDELTHKLFDDLPRDQTTRHVRDSLVATGILPTRQESLARLELWLADLLHTLPPAQARIIEPFAEWQVLRDARRRAARGRYTAAAAAHDRTDIRVAAHFLAWLHDQQRDLDATTQDDLDRWLARHSTRRRRLVTFIHWATARGLTGELVIRTQHAGMPSQFASDAEQHEQLRRCLTDNTLPLEVRITGALVRLYALPLTRISGLTTDRFERSGEHAYYIFYREPVLLPPRLAMILEEQISRPGSVSVLSTPHTPRSPFLLPGRPPHRPRSANSLHKLMAAHGMPTLKARNTAMIEAVTRLPPIVVSDPFGVAAGTAERWARYAQDSWADYLAADHPTDRPATREPRDPEADFAMPPCSNSRMPPGTAVGSACNAASDGHEGPVER